MKAQIPWLRVFVEGVVIVGSILLAFGIQAWWDGVQQEQQEEAYLTAVSGELRTVKARMEDWISQTEDWTQAGDSLLGFTLGGSEIPEETVLHSLLWRTTSWFAFTASTAQLENLVDSPVFPELSDTELREQLSQPRGEGAGSCWPHQGALASLDRRLQSVSPGSR